MAEVGDPLGGLQTTSSIEASHPADLILAPDGHTIYTLGGTTFNRLGIDSRGRLFVDETGTLPEVAERGEFLQEGVLAALVAGPAIKKTRAEPVGIPAAIRAAAIGTELVLQTYIGREIAKTANIPPRPWVQVTFAK